MAQQFVMKEGPLSLTINSERKYFEYQLEFEVLGELKENSAVDIGRIGIAWIVDNLVGSTPVNPVDTEAIEALKLAGDKIWYVSLAGKDGACEPNSTTLSKELFLAMAVLFETHGSLRISRVTVKLGDSYIICNKDSILPEEAHKWLPVHYDTIKQYAENKKLEIYKA